MMRHFALSVLVAGPRRVRRRRRRRTGRAPYDPTAEVIVGGVIRGVVSVIGPDGTVGVHLNLKTGTARSSRCTSGRRCSSA